MQSATMEKSRRQPKWNEMIDKDNDATRGGG